MALQFQKKQTQFKNALARLNEALEEEKSILVRDATIQRFEFSAELFWKMLKVYLFEVEGIEVRSPKDVMRESRNIDIFNDEETEMALRIIFDRNILSHAYLESVAENVYERIPDYVQLMSQTLGKIK